MAQKFSLKEQGKTFKFERDENGFIWLLKDDNSPKVNIGEIQVSKLSNEEEMKEVARKMLYVMNII